MAVKTLNIEIGDRLTKVCLSVPKGKSYQIRRSFMFQTPDNSVSDGAITAPDIFAAELSSKLREHGLADVKNVIFTLASGKVAIREVSLPPVKPSRIKGIVETNAAEYFPIDLSNYHITYSLLERIEKGERAGCRVLALAAPLSLLDGYFKTAEKARLTVKAVDFAGNSQYQALRTIRSQEVTMYVNVDCTNSYVSFMQDGKLLMQRSFTFGGDELITNYMSAANKSPGEYVAALGECSSDPSDFCSSGVMSEADVAESLSRLVGSIVRSSDYFNSNRWEVQVEKVVLMGPCCRLVGLLDMVAQGTGLETQYLDNIPGITSFANVAESASFYISCIGSSIAPLDFIPEQFRSDRKAARKKQAKSESLLGGAVICSACLIAALAFSALSVRGYLDVRKERDSISNQIEELSHVRGVHDTYLQYRKNADELRLLSDSIASPNDELLDFIGELEKKMPSEILVLSAVCSSESVSMNITVPSYDEVAVALVQLRSFESLGELQVSSITEEVDDAGVSHVSFSVNCIYKDKAEAAKTDKNTAGAKNSGKESVGGAAQG